MLKVWKNANFGGFAGRPKGGHHSIKDPVNVNKSEEFEDIDDGNY